MVYRRWEDLSATEVVGLSLWKSKALNPKPQQSRAPEYGLGSETQLPVFEASGFADVKGFSLMPQLGAARCLSRCPGTPRGGPGRSAPHRRSPWPPVNCYWRGAL